MKRYLLFLVGILFIIGAASAYTVDGYDTYYTDGGPAFLRIYGTAPPGEDLRCVIDGIDISETIHTKADTTTRYTVTFAIPPGNGHYTVGIYTGYTYRTGMGARVSMDEAPWLNEGIKGIRPPPVPAIVRPDTTPTPAPDTTYAPIPASTPTLTPEPTSEPTPASAIKVQPASNTTTLNTSSTLRWDAGAGRLIPNTPRPVPVQDHDLNNNLWIACIAVCGIGVLVYLFRQ